jgi:hypothetical protein
MRGKSLWIGIVGVVLVAAIAAAVTMQSASVSRPQTVNEALVLVVEPGVLPLAVSGVVPVHETLVWANVTNGWTGPATVELVVQTGPSSGCATGQALVDGNDVCAAVYTTGQQVIAVGATAGWVLTITYSAGFSGPVNLMLRADGTG